MTSTPITQAVERLTDWLDGKSKPGTPDGHLHLADLRAILASYERMAKALEQLEVERHVQTASAKRMSDAVVGARAALNGGEG